MKVRKLTALFLTFIMVCGVGSINIFGSDSSNYSSTELTTDSDIAFIKNAVYSQDSSGNFIFSRTHSESERIAFSAESSFVKVNDKMVIVPLTPEDQTEIAEKINVLRAGGTIEEEIDGAVIVTLSVRYEKSTDRRGDELIDITNVSGSYSYNPNNRATVTSQSVRIGQTGIVEGGGFETQRIRLNPGTSARWSYPIELGWDPVYEIEANCGATLELDYDYGNSQGGYSDTISLTVNVSESEFEF